MMGDLKTLFPQHRVRTSDAEHARLEWLVQLFRDCPIPEAEILMNLGLFMNGPALARILFMVELYQKIVGVQGSVIEFGPRWGQNMALWTELRGFYEPYNHGRKIIGFDTFKGLSSVGAVDGEHTQDGEYTTTEDYEKYLASVLRCHEAMSPVSHIQKFEIVKGDACEEFPAYLEAHPELIVALAYFDFDIYHPTKVCLGLLIDRMPAGAVIGFDQLNRADFPGETVAVREVLGIRGLRLQRTSHSRETCFVVTS